MEPDAGGRRSGRRKRSPKKTRGTYGRGSFEDHGPLRDGSYRYSWLYWENGKKRRSPRFDSEEKRDEWIEQYKRTRGRIANRGSFADAAERWLASRAAAPAKIAGYRGFLDNHILPVFGHRKLADITTDDLNAYITGKEAGTLPVRGKAHAKVGRPSIALHVQMIRSIWEYAADQGLVVGRNPAGRDRSTKLAKLKQEQKKPRALGDVAFARLWQALPEKERAQVALLCFTGLRSQETAALRWGDWNKSTISVERARKAGGRDIGPPKSKHSIRTLACSKQVNRILAEHHRRQKAAGVRVGDDELMFPNSRGKVQDASNYRGKLERICKRAGLPVVKPHELRHTFAVRLIDEHVTLADLAQMMGHENAVVTMREYISYINKHLPTVPTVETNVKRARERAESENRAGHEKRGRSGRSTRPPSASKQSAAP